MQHFSKKALLTATMLSLMVTGGIVTSAAANSIGGAINGGIIANALQAECSTDADPTGGIQYQIGVLQAEIQKLLEENIILVRDIRHDNIHISISEQIITWERNKGADLTIALKDLNYFKEKLATDEAQLKKNLSAIDAAIRQIADWMHMCDSLRKQPKRATGAAPKANQLAPQAAPSAVKPVLTAPQTE